MDLDHLYIDGSKFEANANKYSWVWKKGTEKSRFRLYTKISALLEEINGMLGCSGLKVEINSEYAPEYLELILSKLHEIWSLDEEKFVHGKGHHKSPEQRNYEKLKMYLHKIKEYGEKLSICGENRNSYSKMDHSATFMRIKRDYMGNDQLLPAYNVQVGIADEYIWEYGRIVRKGMDSVKMEVFLVSIGFNLYKYHRKQQAHMDMAA